MNSCGLHNVASLASVAGDAAILTKLLQRDVAAEVSEHDG